jgi:hypothetical protein
LSKKGNKLPKRKKKKACKSWRMMMRTVKDFLLDMTWLSVALDAWTRSSQQRFHSG